MKYILYSIFLISNITFCQERNLSNEGRVGEWFYLTDVRTENNLNQVIKLTEWQKIDKFPVVFGKNQKVTWLKTRIVNKESNEKFQVLITKGIDSLNSFLILKGQTNTYITGKYIPLDKRFVPSQYLTVPIDLPPNTQAEVIIRIYNQGYQLSLPYLKILEEKKAYKFIKMGELGYNIYFGGIFLMTLFSILLFIFFKERLYLLYFFCLVCSFLLAFYYNDFYYLFFEKPISFIRNKNIFAVLTTVLNCTYLLFAEQYLKIDPTRNLKLLKISRIVIIILFAQIIILLGLNKELYYYRGFFFPLFGINVTIMYFYLLKSIQKKYPPSWFFLVASTPIAFVSILEITSDFNGVPVQTMHDLYYLGTFIEMFFLTIGIVYRFRIERTISENLQNDFLDAESRAHEKIKNEIAKDLHGNVNASLVVGLNNLRELEERYFKDKKTPVYLSKTILSLEKTSDDIRSISHQLKPQVLSNLGLVQELISKYGELTNPVFKLSMSEKNINLDEHTELILDNIINEAVQNIIKHAKATEVSIEIFENKKQYTLRIEDNGIGFEMGKGESNGMGISNIKNRVEKQLKGNFKIESSPGNGTIIFIKFKSK